jgi:hypothetical protein
VLETAYDMNPAQNYGEQASDLHLKEVMRSYVLMYTGQIYGEGLKSKDRHKRAKDSLINSNSKNVPGRADEPLSPHHLADAEVKAAVEAKRRENPFAGAPSLTSHDGARVADRLSESFGRFQNEECSILRAGLKSMDVEGSGRVPFKDFSGKRVGDYVFLEPKEYLQDLGVLDETDPEKGSQVLIPNYVASLSNCVDVSDYYSVCCLDTCSGVMATLETRIRAPTATVEEIVYAMGAVTTDFLEEPRNLTKGTRLRAMLEEVGEASDDSINLHGRLLAQWLHYAFPHECPYPQSAGTTAPQTVREWEKKAPAQIPWDQLQSTNEITPTKIADLPSAGGEEIIVDEADLRAPAPENSNQPRKPSGWKMEEHLFTAPQQGKSRNSSWSFCLVGLLLAGLVGAAKMRKDEKDGPGGGIMGGLMQQAMNAKPSMVVDGLLSACDVSPSVVQTSRLSSQVSSSVGRRHILAGTEMGV